MKRIGIVGMGGVGGFIGALLANKFYESEEVQIVFIAKGKSRDAIEKYGIQLILPNEERVVGKPALVSSRAEEIGILDALVFCVKSYSLRESLQMYQSCIGDETLVVTLQNMVAAEKMVAQELDRGIALPGCIYVISNTIEHGVVKHMGGLGKVLIGGEIDKVNWLYQAFKDAGINIEHKVEIQSMIWSKFLFVSPLAMVTAAHKVSLGQLFESEKLEQQLIGLMKEVEELAKVKGIELQEDTIERSVELAKSFPYEGKTSFQLDIENKKPNELDTLGIYIVNASIQEGIEASYYQKAIEQLLVQIT